MSKKTDAQVVICSYQPKPGKLNELLEILRGHVVTLRVEKLATGYPHSIVTSESGGVIDIFEWESGEAAEKAHQNPEVQKIWKAIGEVAEFIPLAKIPETAKLFPHFKRVFLG